MSAPLDNHAKKLRTRVARTSSFFSSLQTSFYRFSFSNASRMEPSSDPSPSEDGVPPPSDIPAEIWKRALLLTQVSEPLAVDSPVKHTKAMETAKEVHIAVCSSFLSALAFPSAVYKFATLEPRASDAAQHLKSTAG